MFIEVPLFHETSKVLKILESIKKLIKQLVVIDEIQFNFMPGYGATKNIVILRQLLEKNLAKKEEFVFFLHKFRETF